MSRPASLRRFLAVSLAAGLLAVGCESASAPVGGEPTEAERAAAEPTPTTTPPTEALATAASTVQGLTLEVLAFERTSANVVTLELALDYQGEEAWEAGNRFAELPSDGRVVSGIYVVDERGQRKHLVLRDERGECLCSELEFFFNPDTRHAAFAQFPAPPPEVESMTVYVPTFMPLPDVPLQEG